MKSAYHSDTQHHTTGMDENDKSILALILEMRLSETAVKSVSLNTSTQKAEAFNRAAIATMPKEINFSRNFSGRLAAQTLKSNNSVAEAVKRKSEEIAHTSLSEMTVHHLEQISKSYKYNKAYKSKSNVQEKTNSQPCEGWSLNHQRQIESKPEHQYGL